MKTKKINKKLSLNKKTVALLDRGHMTEVKGGEGTHLKTICILCMYTETCQTCQTCWGITCEGSCPEC